MFRALLLGMREKEADAEDDANVPEGVDFLFLLFLCLSILLLLDLVTEVV